MWQCPSLHSNRDKLKDMGIENNATCCKTIGTIIHIDLNEGAKGNADKEFNNDVGNTAGLTAHVISGSAGCGQNGGEENKHWHCFDAKFALCNSIKWMAEQGHEGTQRETMPPWISKAAVC